MDIHSHADFLRAQGITVIETPSCYWHDRGTRLHIGPQWIHFFVNGPAHKPVNPKRAEVMKVLLEGRAIGVKFATGGKSKGMDSYMLICTDPGYDLSSLDANARNKVRQGLRRCTLEEIGFDRLAGVGMDIMRDSWARQGREPAMTERWWQQFCRAAQHFDGVEAWGAFVRGDLAAFMTTTLLEDACLIGFRWSREKYLPQRPNNALEFAVTRHMLKDRGVRLVYHGLEPVEHLDSLVRYKIGMGFTQVPVRQRVIFNPLFGLLLSPPAVALGRKVIQRHGDSEFWRRVDGILRFYEGSESACCGEA